jgi:bifunctional DNA-binding transcriptional regulator/antitoxin component of YhaV-PrlF toxin-antitoxin module
MTILISRTRAQGASVITTLPVEVARRLGISPGQELEWIEDGMGGFRVVPHTPETAEALEAHTRIMAEYDAVFRALAK